MTAIVVTYNSSGQIVPTLAALAAAQIDTIVVDNASRDDTVGLVTRDFPGVRLVVGRENLGFATAVNRGLDLVTTDTVLLVNPDCVVDPETIGRLVDAVRDSSDIAVACPRIIGADGTTAISAHAFETVRSVVLSRFGGSLVPVGIRRRMSGRRRRDAYDVCRSSADVQGVDWVSGACMAVDTEVLRSIGGLDARYFLYYEDEDLCWQVRERNRAVVLVPSVTVSHVGGASSQLGATWVHLYRSMLVFFALHRPADFGRVRRVLLLRSAVGVAMGGARTALRRPGGSARLTAWRDVFSQTKAAHTPADLGITG